MTTEYSCPVIMVVDDNHRNLKLMGNLLRQWSYKSVLAQNAEECLAFVEKKLPDLILMDVLMPGMNGFEACKTLKNNERTCRIPVVFITALSDTATIVRGFETGGVDYITKPFIPEEVKARLNVHLQLKSALDKLARMSVTDEMTGVFNRRHAFDVIKREAKLADRLHRQFTVCYLDIDNLKLINDRHGHDAGDELIKTVVNVIAAGIRQTDYIFRMGGDEFMLILPETGMGESKKLLERLHSRVNEQELYDRRVDFSYGLALYDPGDTPDVKEVIDRADTAMYAFKNENKSVRSKTDSTS